MEKLEPFFEHFHKSYEGEVHHFDLEDNLIFLAEYGSTAYGTRTEGSDTDLVGVAIPPIDVKLGYQNWEGWDKQIGDVDLKIYSLSKYIRLTGKGNPNSVGWVNVPERCINLLEPPFDKVIEKKDDLLSWKMVDSFVGYAYGRLKKINNKMELPLEERVSGYMGEQRKKMVREHGWDVKDGSHLLRISRMGAEIAQGKGVIVDRTGIDAEEIKEVRRGEWSVEEVKEEAKRQLDIVGREKEENPDRFEDKLDQEFLNDLLLDCLSDEYNLKKQWRVK